MNHKSHITKKAEANVQELRKKATQLHSLENASNNYSNQALVMEAIRHYTDYLNDEANRIEKSLLNGSEDGNLLSQDESHILAGCISLMGEVYNHFEQWLDWMNLKMYDEERDAARFSTSYEHIVRHLFLWSTNHSGGTSTYAKCRELGVYDKDIEFNLKKCEDE